jgi:hypothetical protein
VVKISGTKTDSFGYRTDFNTTILEEATASVSAPAIAGDSLEFTFVRWKDERGTTVTTETDYTFVLTRDRTIVAEYDGSPSIWHGPIGWWSSDIGTLGGRAVQDGNTYELTGDGHNIWGTADGFHFMFKELTGNGSITARVVSNGTGNDARAKGGVMIRNELSPDSAHATTVLTGGESGGAAFNWRSSTGAKTSSAHSPTPSVSPPYWVRVERLGNEFTGYLSADGIDWRQQGPTRAIDMHDTVYIGLSVTSHDAGAFRTYTFDNLSHDGLITDSLQDSID